MAFEFSLTGFVGITQLCFETTSTLYAICERWRSMQQQYKTFETEVEALRRSLQLLENEPAAVAASFVRHQRSAWASINNLQSFEMHDIGRPVPIWHSELEGGAIYNNFRATDCSAKYNCLDLSSAPEVVSSHRQRQDRRPVELVNKLSEWDVSKEMLLPHLVACGDQSSGKSSVLEAISGIQFSRDELDRSTFRAALSTKALEGLGDLNAAGTLTPRMLAEQYLPDVLLSHGPLAIRHIMGYLTASVPGFSRLPSFKARRLVLAALEGRCGGLEDTGDSVFEKVGWGRWDARTNVGTPSFFAPELIYDDMTSRHHKLEHESDRPYPDARRSPSHPSTAHPFYVIYTPGLIDTPGFMDTHNADRDALKMLVAWLSTGKWTIEKKPPSLEDPQFRVDPPFAPHGAPSGSLSQHLAPMASPHFSRINSNPQQACSPNHQAAYDSSQGATCQPSETTSSQHQFQNQPSHFAPRATALFQQQIQHHQPHIPPMLTAFPLQQFPSQRQYNPLESAALPQQHSLHPQQYYTPWAPVAPSPMQITQTPPPLAFDSSPDQYSDMEGPELDHDILNNLTYLEDFNNFNFADYNDFDLLPVGDSFIESPINEADFFPNLDTPEYPESPLTTQTQKYRCQHEDCTESFPRQCDLKRHELKHTRPFICPECGNGFAEKRRCIQHVQMVHGLATDKDKKHCHLCNYAAVRPDAVKRHLRLKHGVGNKSESSPSTGSEGHPGRARGGKEGRRKR